MFYRFGEPYRIPKYYFKNIILMRPVDSLFFCIAIHPSGPFVCGSSCKIIFFSQIPAPCFLFLSFLASLRYRWDARIRWRKESHWERITWTAVHRKIRGLLCWARSCPVPCGLYIISSKCSSRYSTVVQNFHSYVRNTIAIKSSKSTVGPCPEENAKKQGN